MKNNEICKNAGFISEDELVELVDNNDISGGTASAISATVASATAVSALFTVTSACTKKCK
ncbi:hypothetical protein FDF50_03410 [Clostridium botulinum]|uniref:Uncharacterized protein n=1 Tax=Clostridium botulinum TaxID=1491 RepID=A0A6G4HS74_CLOBO|nr:class II lanthipeptide, LchA2/BrtA2 family [Clostridium botulinum]MBD5586063.1 hypothetical protein [Clostridium botulinum]MBO0570402.1 hypothetical protein [Clostridium botulinum]MBO0581715.1 hypothetical protein [Clostridium botulinum]NFJ59719.1 hypothetical protein [Clostridium botulinum]NFJ67522.1 hypothetical protein [Clostridium botulinum]